MKYTFNIKDDINLYQVKLLIIFIVQYLETKLPNLEIDDTIIKIPEEIKNQFKKI